MESSYLLITLITLLFSAFFSGMEIAFISANRLKIELDNKQGIASAKILSLFFKHPKKFIGAMLVGNNIALVFYGIYFGRLLMQLIFGLDEVDEYTYPTLALLTQTGISTIVILFTAEFIPKSLFAAEPNRWLSFFSVPLLLLYGLLWLPAIFITAISRWFLRTVFKADTSNTDIEFGRIDLDHFIRSITENIDPEDEVEHELQIFQNALEFNKVKVRSCMIPRNELVAVPFETTIEDLTHKFVESGHSKILVYRDSIDRIIGYVHCNELFKKPEHLKTILLPVAIVPEPMAASELMALLIKQNRHIAVVVDEFGGTSGIATLEDIVEEIFGEIEDEHDFEDWVEEELGEDEYLFSGRAEIDYLIDKYKLEIEPSEDYDTLAGLLIAHLEDLPKEGNEIHIEPYIFTVKEMSNTRVELVHLSLKDE